MRTTTGWAALLGAAATITGWAAAPVATAADVRASAARASTALLADGRPSFGEWPATGPSAPGLKVALSADDERLHVLVDGLGITDAQRRPSAAVLVDVDRNGRETPGVDVRYVALPDGTALRQRYTGALEGGFGPPEPTASSAAMRFDCFAADGTRSYQSAQRTIRCDRHHAAEFAIDLREIDARPGTVVDAVLEIGSGRERVVFPAITAGRFDSTLSIELPPVTQPPTFATARLEIPGDGVEMLQTTQGNLQTRLVAQKPTVVRVLPRVLDADDDKHPISVRLRGFGPGGELPGSPLKQQVAARFDPDRMVPADGATFLLPASWTAAGILTVWADATQAVGAPASVTAANARFVPTLKTSVWSFPVKTGFGTPASSVLDLQESRADTILPVADMYFPRRPARNGSPWAEGARDEAVELYAEAKATWSETKQKTGSAPYRLPRQVYGHHHPDVGDGGISDPVWGGGGGRGAGGDLGSSLELTMAHEMDHNLDRKDDPTWGGHIGGCDATDDDQNWPWPDLTIHDKGFDVANLIPVDTDERDLMTYCRKDSAGPAKWMGAYRWVNLLDAFLAGTGATITDATASADADAADPADPATAPDVLQISGWIDASSRAVTLEPVFRGAGVPQEPAPEGPGAHAIEVLDAAGDVLDRHALDVSFEHPEGGTLRRAAFGIDLAAPDGVHEVRVVSTSDERVLARRVLSATAPQVRIVSPNGGERLGSAPFDLVVDARDADGDGLDWRVMASGDGGATWLPVDGEPSGGRLRIDPAALPGGAESVLRVEATDGLRTSTDESDAPFALPVTPPQPSIRQPLDGARLRTGQVAVLRGNATTSSLQELPGENLLWFAGDRLVGEGEEARVLLAPGTHVLRLLAVDAVGAVAGTDRVTVQVGGTCGPAGVGDPDSDEAGPVSRPLLGIRQALQPLVPAPARLLHRVNCGTVVPNSL